MLRPPTGAVPRPTVPPPPAESRLPAIPTPCLARPPARSASAPHPASARGRQRPRLRRLPSLLTAAAAELRPPPAPRTLSPRPADWSTAPARTPGIPPVVPPPATCPRPHAP